MFSLGFFVGIFGRRQICDEISDEKSTYIIHNAKTSSDGDRNNYDDDHYRKKVLSSSQ